MRRVTFDRELVLSALKRATALAWERISALAPPEHAYGLVLYEGAEYGYVCVTVLTEEGLTRVADRYQSGKWAADYAGDDGKESLRWSTCDSPYHATTEVSVPPLVSSDDLYRLWTEWDRDDAPGDSYKHAIRELCKQALKELDAEGLFAPDREALTLMIEDRDGTETADDFRLIVTELNPPAALVRYDEFRVAVERVWARRNTS